MSTRSDIDRILNETERAENLWKRRLLEGHGAYQEGEGNYDAPIVMIAGPIAHWWGARWMSLEHIRYLAWREKLEEELIAAGCCIYRPYAAIKGEFNPLAQKINDVVVQMCHVLVDASPADVASTGTVDEVRMRKQHGGPIVIAPHPIDPAQDAWDLGAIVGEVLGSFEKMVNRHPV